MRRIALTVLALAALILAVAALLGTLDRYKLIAVGEIFAYRVDTWTGAVTLITPEHMIALVPGELPEASQARGALEELARQPPPSMAPVQPDPLEEQARRYGAEPPPPVDAQPPL